MFAYCGNNPVNRIDPTGNLWWQIFLVALCIASEAALITGVNHMVAYKNHSKNSAVDSDTSTSTNNKIINDQNGTTGKNFEVGDHSASYNSCGAIAIHNAKVHSGIDSTLSDTIADLQTSGAMIGVTGSFGFNPYAFSSVLKASGLSYTPISLADMSNAGLYVITYWNSDNLMDGAHTVAVFFDGTTYVTYNYSGNGTPGYLSPFDYAENFIYGYQVG